MIGDSFPPPDGGGTREVVVQVQVMAASASVRVQRRSRLPPAGGGSGEVVVQVQAGSRSSFRPGPASFPPPVGGGTREVVVQVRDGVRGVFRSSCPSAASFLPPRGGGTRGVVVRVRDDVRGGFCLSVAAFPPSVEGGTLGGVGDRAQATTRVGPAPWLFLATPGIGTCVAECFAANPVHSVKLLQGLPG